MRNSSQKKKTLKTTDPNVYTASLLAALCALLAVFVYIVHYSHTFLIEYDRASADVIASSTPQGAVSSVATLDKSAYDKKMLQIANYGTSSVRASTSTATTTKRNLWPVHAAYPNAGAILPFKRIVAYYGNFYSKGMGVLGEYPEDVMLAKLKAEVHKWEVADPSTPVIPAIEYIDVTAQGSPGKDGKYRLRMPDDQIDKALAIADKVHGIVILDIQVGLSTVQNELPLLDEYLKKPNLHIAIDPEFSMKTGDKPGSVIGSYNAADINYVAQYLAKIVRDNNLPPKVLIVHRFTEPMVVGYKKILPLPEVQIVMVMDGWGSPSRKIGTYNAFIAPEPVQFTGFKLFYKNDVRPPSTRLLTPGELLKLKPQPVFIQYQ